MPPSVLNHDNMAAKFDHNPDVTFFVLCCVGDSILLHMFVQLLVTLHMPFTSDK